MASSMELLILFNFHQWKGDMEIHLCTKGLYRVTMVIEEEPTRVIDKARLLRQINMVLELTAGQSSFSSKTWFLTDLA